MLHCHTLVINGNKGTDTNGLSIGGLELKIKEDGSLSTTDSDGIETVINNGNGNSYGRIKHLEVGINNTIQVIQGHESQIYFDDGFSVVDDDDFEIGDDGNSVKILTTGHFFISFNISLDMYSGSKSTVGGYIKSNSTIIDKSTSYTYFHGKSQGFGSINNSFIYDVQGSEEITFHVKRKEGSGKYYTVPTATNFNIFRID